MSIVLPLVCATYDLREWFSQFIHCGEVLFGKDLSTVILKTIDELCLHNSNCRSHKDQVMGLSLLQSPKMVPRFLCVSIKAFC